MFLLLETISWEITFRNVVFFVLSVVTVGCFIRPTSGDKRESGGISIDRSHNSGGIDVKMDRSAFDKISKDCLPLLN